VLKNKKLIFKQYENYVIIALILLAIILLFILVRIPSKEIASLKEYKNGKFKISGFISNIVYSEKYTKFKLTDSTGTIQIIAFHTINDLKEGKKIEVVCNLETTKYGKECIIN